MESRNKLEMCRLCLCENECFVNIFEMNDWQGYVAAEVISDLLQFQVSETDAYPHVVCLACLSKLTDFKQFKECCQKSKAMYDDMFVSHGSQAENKPETVEVVTVKVEPICYSENEDEDSKVGFVTVKAEPIYCSDNESNESKPIMKQEELDISGDEYDEPFVGTNIEEELTRVETVTNLEYLQCLEDTRPDSSGTMERLEGLRILPGESVYMTPPFQQNISVGKAVEKEMGRAEEYIGEDVEGCSETGPEYEVREGLECFHCGIVLMNKLDLKQHMKVHGFVNSYECSVCGEEFCFNSEFKRHVLTHTVSKAYKCGECGKSFSGNYLLKRHMRSHTGSKPYKCTECSKSYSRNYHLKTHMRTHTGFKPYKCEDCSKSFSDISNFKKHKNTHRF